jgi:predicted glycosyl hydrolase (DUF1957 family)
MIVTLLRQLFGRFGSVARSLLLLLPFVGYAAYNRQKQRAEKAEDIAADLDARNRQLRETIAQTAKVDREIAEKSDSQVIADLGEYVRNGDD